MTQQFESPTSSAPPSRDLMRTALRELVTLCTGCIADEAKIETTHAATLDQAKRDFEKATWAADQRHQSARDNLHKEYRDRRTRIEEQFQSDLAALNQSAESARRRIDHDRAAVERDVKQSLQQAQWLAESVFDGTQAQIREEAKKAKETLASRNETLDAMHTKAVNLVQWYNQTPPAVREGEAPAEPPSDDPETQFTLLRESVQQRLDALGRLQVPRLFVGARPHFAFLFLVAGAVGITQFSISLTEPQWKPMGIALGVSVVVLFAIRMALSSIARSHVRDEYLPLQQTLAAARRVAQQHYDLTRRQLEQRHEESIQTRDQEIKKARDKAAPILEQAGQKHQSAMQSIEEQRSTKLAALEEHRDRDRSESEQWQRTASADIEHRHTCEQEAAKQKYDRQIAEAHRIHAESRSALENRLKTGLASVQSPFDAASANGQAVRDWSDPAWRDWTPPRQFASLVRAGRLHVDLRHIAESSQTGNRVQASASNLNPEPRTLNPLPITLDLPPAFALPVGLAFPNQASLLIQTDRPGRMQAIGLLQLVMARLLTSLPPGRARFTIIDPVGLGQNFAGFMHLADHDEALVGGRIWTESDQIEQRLANLTEHMETVIQKYLRNEFETIDDYNAQAGELAEPYRFLVIADFPVGFAGDSFRRLSSIATTGARCGVYTLVLRDTREPLPTGSCLEDLEAHSINLVRDGDRFVWKDPVFRQFPLTLDDPPAEQLLTSILDVVGTHAKHAKRVEVPFETIVPPPDKLWSSDSSTDLSVPVGKMGATRLQNVRLGRGVAQHALIAGKTGSGKSTLLHVLVTNLALWYSPDQVEFYLVDFKKGVEFKTYATHALPHARAIAVESDREFGLSVLQRVDAELSRRGTLYRKLGVQDLASYRAAVLPSPSGRGQGEGGLGGDTARYPRLPRTLLIIDEFQEFFSEDDKLAQDASLLLDRLVRQGRAFGIHVLLGSQTIGGTSGLSRSTLGQMAIRVALQCSEADSQMILGDANSAARLLSRPGEAIYNDAGGLVEANSPFQISWLPDETRDHYLQQIASLTHTGNWQLTINNSPIVFEGNAPADITKNQKLARFLDSPPTTLPLAPAAFLGDPVAIKDPTAITFRRQSGSNAIIIGQHEESSLAMMLSAIISLAAQHPPKTATFYILDGTPADSPLAGRFEHLKSILPHDLRVIDYRSVPDAINELTEELHRRHDDTSHGTHHSAVYLFVYGLQRYRILRKQEDSFSFSSSEEAKPQPDKQFAELLRDGPALGIHTITWCDTAASIDRALDRNTLREFDHRILFQMSASDSSNLIDSPLANKLGFHRALAYSEEQGTQEKFRPYALPDKTWLEKIRLSLGASDINHG